MKKERMPFIVFEGIDGAGNTTQSQALDERLSKNYKVKLTKEPTDGLIGSLTRGVLRNELKVDEKTFALLFAADRMLHIKNIILKSLNKGFIVISDRYRLSNYAYQSVKRVDEKWLKCLNEKTINPDLTFIIDTLPEECIRRKEKKFFSMEKYEKLPTLKKVREKYLKLAKEESNTFVINGNPYLFCWDKIPGSDIDRLIEFLIREFDIHWLRAAKIEKIDDFKTISITNRNNFLSLRQGWDEKKNKIVKLEIDDGRTEIFITNMENDELNIHRNPSKEIISKEIFNKVIESKLIPGLV